MTIQTLLEYLGQKEQIDFKALLYTDEETRGIYSFYAIIPQIFEVSRLGIKKAKYTGVEFKIFDVQGRDALKGPCCIIWSKDVEATKGGMTITKDSLTQVVFENFRFVPEFLGVQELQELQELESDCTKREGVGCEI